jgi:hypothetical protein
VSRLLLVAVLLMAAPRGIAVPVETRAVTPLQGFDGRWVLDAKRSEFGATQSVLRARIDDVVTDSNRVLVRSRYVRANGDTTRLNYVYRIPGVAENTLGGQLVHTTGRRVGKTLEFVSVVKILLLELKAEEHWSLAAGGDSLVMERTANSPLGAQHQVLYFGLRGHAGLPGGP